MDINYQFNKYYTIIMEQKHSFSDSQERVIAASTLGLSIQMMADHLDMNYDTLCGHLKIIYVVLGIHSMPELIMYAFNNGYNKP